MKNNSKSPSSDKGPIKALKKFLIGVITVDLLFRVVL